MRKDKINYYLDIAEAVAEPGALGIALLERYPERFDLTVPYFVGQNCLPQSKIHSEKNEWSWTEALPMMKVGSKWQLFVPPHLAYGRGGLPPRIPPNTVLVFEMELLAIEKGDQAGQEASTTIAQQQPVRKMNITGQIAKAAHGYIIRGQEPQMIWTILNPDPKILDGFVKSEKIVPIEVRIVSGDNVDIEKIDGRAYR